MRRLVMLFLFAVFSVSLVEPAFAKHVVHAHKGKQHRKVVVVHHGWPLHRAQRTVVVHPVRVTYRVAPAVFLPLVVWTGVVVAGAPARDVLVWEDGETITSDEDWTEFTLNCDSRGTQLWVQVASGRAQFDWAEVTFENGEARVVDMKESTRSPGLYPLLDFSDGRRVDHVRVIARAKSDAARVVLKMEK